MGDIRGGKKGTEGEVQAIHGRVTKSKSARGRQKYGDCEGFGRSGSWKCEKTLREKVEFPKRQMNGGGATRKRGTGLAPEVR